MTNTEKLTAIELVKDMVAHGYSLGQYKDAQALVEYYESLPLDWWQRAHDKFMD